MSLPARRTTINAQTIDIVTPHKFIVAFGSTFLTKVSQKTSYRNYIIILKTKVIKRETQNLTKKFKVLLLYFSTLKQQNKIYFIGSRKKTNISFLSYGCSLYLMHVIYFKHHHMFHKLFTFHEFILYFIFFQIADAQFLRKQISL